MMGNIRRRVSGVNILAYTYKNDEFTLVILVTLLRSQLCWWIKPSSQGWFNLVRLVETWICKEKAVWARLKGRSCQMSYLSNLESLGYSVETGTRKKSLDVKSAIDRFQHFTLTKQQSMPDGMFWNFALCNYYLFLLFKKYIEEKKCSKLFLLPKKIRIFSGPFKTTSLNWLFFFAIFYPNVSKSFVGLVQQALSIRPWQF